METLFGWQFSGAWNWLLGKLGISPQEKFGGVEVMNTPLTNDLKEKTHEAEVFEVPDRPEPAVTDLTLKHAGKWREQHSDAHEQVIIDFTIREMPAEPVPLFPEEKQA